MSQGLDDQPVAVVNAELAFAALALARRFADGATLWCWSPGAPDHAQHVAVEFVHPVIVGTRALPAVAVADGHVTATLRTMARAGDALVVVSSGDAAIEGVLKRAEAWGLTAVWMGCGPRPDASSADHLLWLGDDPQAHHDGRLVLGYHLLWELTHVCFEHPGLLREPTAPEGPTCTTCSDEGRLGEVVTSHGDDATIRTPCGIETVTTLLVGPVAPGDLVLVHAGTAITVVDA
jgi:hypothetical protein